MIGQLKTLLRIKELREEQAFRVVNTKRREVADSLIAIEVAQKKVRDNATTLPGREDAIYSKIMGRIIDYDEIEETKSEMHVLEKEHNNLLDAVERASHVKTRLQKQLSDAIDTHRKTVKARDKYIALTDNISAELRTQATQREEIELEDIFNTRHRRFA